MAFLPWVSLTALTAIFWLPGGWPQPLPAELLGGLLLLISLLQGRQALLVCLPIVCALLQAEHHLADRLSPSLTGQDFLVRGQICDFPRQQGRVLRFPVYIEPLEGGGRLPSRLSISWYDTEQVPQAGESWLLKVRLREPRGFASPGAADSERNTFVRRLGARGYVRASAHNRRLSTRGTVCRTAPLRRWVLGKVDAIVGEHPVAPYLTALTVGARHRLTQADWELLRLSGTAHLMAISGLHIGLVAAAAMLVGRVAGSLLCWLGCFVAPRTLGWWLAVVCASAYAVISGFGLPVQRALAMLGVLFFLHGLRRSLGAWSILSIALWIALVTNGLAILTAGFWLSFGAVAVLLCASLGGRTAPLSAGVQDWIKRLAEAQWRVFVGLLPVTTLAFGQLALLAPLANALAVPVFAFFIMPLVFSGLISAVLGLGWPVLTVAGDLLAALLRVLPWFTRGAWSPASAPGWTLPLLGLAAAILLWPRPTPGRLPAALVLALLLTVSPPGRHARELRITVLDVGQGLAVLVQAGRRTLLYDTGPAFAAGDAGRSVVIPALRRAGVRSLDVMVVSHGDADHAGGAASVLRDYPGAALFAPAGQSGPLAAVDCVAGQTWTWGEVSFRFLHPRAGRTVGSENDNSCVLLIQAPGASVLLPGDIGTRGEALLRWGGLQGPFDLIVAAHHGSKTSSSSAFVAATRPRFVVFSTGWGNRWGFPHPAVAERWRRSGACLLNTAEQGALVFGAVAGQLDLLYRHRLDRARGWTLAGAEPQACDKSPPFAVISGRPQL